MTGSGTSSSTQLWKSSVASRPSRAKSWWKAWSVVSSRGWASWPRDHAMMTAWAAGLGLPGSLPASRHWAGSAVTGGAAAVVVVASVVVVVDSVVVVSSAVVVVSSSRVVVVSVGVGGAVLHAAWSGRRWCASDTARV